MPVKDNYIVRNMTATELENVALEWAANEGWNPGLHDALAFYNTDPDGFFIGVLNNEPVACISAVAYNNNFGFIGFYIVKPEYRKEGYSIKLCNHAIKHLHSHNIGLDGVVEQQDNYRKMGFKVAHKNIRYEGVAEQRKSVYPHIVPLASIPFEMLKQYDSLVFPAPRDIFLQNWIALPDSLAMASTHNNQLTGYGVIRKCRTGYKIGPLFANSPILAHELLLSLLSEVPDSDKFYLDIPDTNVDALELTRTMNMQKVFETARMYSTSFPEIKHSNIYGITSFELG
jgi:ribosomal protein S18 acetylase RimI-like enzyme